MFIFHSKKFLKDMAFNIYMLPNKLKLVCPCVMKIFCQHNLKKNAAS